jgi:putative spermidine/putrescine transport system permease protein
MRLWNGALRAVVAAVLLFLPAPIVIVVVSSFTKAGYISFPPGELSLRWYAEFLGSADWLATLGLSAALAALAATLSTAVTFLGALAVTRRRLPMAHGLETLVLLPLIFPHAALGVIMLGLVAMFGWTGQFVGLLLAHFILTIPYAWRPIVAAMRKHDLAIEEAAMSLGAPPFYTFRKVTLPLLRPGLVTALLFTFIISFDEVTVSLFLVGPDLSTLPVKIFSTIQDSGSPVIAAVSAMLVGLTILAVFVLDRVVGLELFVAAEERRRPAA